MDSISENKIVLSLTILALGTIAVFAPNFIFLAVGALFFTVLTFRFPVFGIAVTILAACAGEFGRISLDGVSFLPLDLAASGTLLIWIARKLLLKEKIEIDKISGSLLIFWMIAILSLLIGFTELSPSEFHFALLYLVRFIGISGILMVTRDLTKKQSEKAFWVLISSSVLFALAGFALFQILPDFTEAGLTELGWDPHIGRLTSTFLDPNFAAGLFAFLLALLGGRFLREKKAKLKIWTLLAAFALGAGLLLTFSRSGLLALGVSGLVLGIFVNRRILVAGAFIVLLGIASSPRLAERIGELAQSVESLGGESQQTLDPTAQLRFDSWSEGWRIFEENSLIGVGFGAYKFHQDFSAEDSHAATGSDSSLLNIAAMTGTLGFLVFGILLWNLASAAWHSKNWGFLAGISGLLVHSIFVNSLLFAPIAAIFFVSAGLNTTKKIGARERIEAGSTTVPK